MITHAGLTEGYWRRTLGAPADAGRAAQLLNAMIGSRDELLFRGGQLLGGGRPNPGAGPLWASAATELLPGWLEADLPFSQVHGHTSLFRWGEGRFVAIEISSGSGPRSTSDARHETTTLVGGRIVGVDPGHDQQPRGPWRAWEPSD